MSQVFGRTRDDNSPPLSAQEVELMNAQLPPPPPELSPSAIAQENGVTVESLAADVELGAAAAAVQPVEEVETIARHDESELGEPTLHLPMQPEHATVVPPAAPEGVDEIVARLLSEISTVVQAEVAAQLAAFKREVAEQFAQIGQLEHLADAQGVQTELAKLTQKIGAVAQHVGRATGIQVPGI